MTNKNVPNNRFIESILLFINNNQTVCRMNLIAITIVTSYSVTNIYPNVFRELFVGADMLYNMLSNIALSCIASTMFFTIQSYIPNIHKNKLRRKDAAIDLIYVMNIIQEMHGYIQLWNYGDILQEKNPTERFDCCVNFLKESYYEIISCIKEFKNTYYDICSVETFDFLSEIQTNSDLKMFTRLVNYKDTVNFNNLVFSEKTLDILMDCILRFQEIENRWLVNEDSERIEREFTYRHISLYGMMCDKDEWDRDISA